MNAETFLQFLNEKPLMVFAATTTTCQLLNNRLDDGRHSGTVVSPPAS